MIGAATWLPPEGYPIPPATPGDPPRPHGDAVPPCPDPRRRLDAVSHARRTARTRRSCTGTSALLGVDRATRVKGSARGSSTTRWNRLDREGLPAYLETDKESNLAWYARRRFDLRETLHPPLRSPGLDHVARPPGQTHPDPPHPRFGGVWDRLRVLSDAEIGFTAR